MGSIRKNDRRMQGQGTTSLTRHGSRLLAVLPLVILSSALVASCSRTLTAPPGRVTFSPISYDEALRAGQVLKFDGKGAFIARTSGGSMGPDLPPNAIIVLRPVAFESLSAGMTVGFLDGKGDRLLHQLTRKAGPGAWAVKGIMNNREDRQLVTPDNLIGVLYAVFYNEASDPDPE